MRLRCDSATNRKASSENWKASSENRKVFSEEPEGFFRRALGLYTHKFLKRGAASLTYLPRLCLDLPCSHLCLPRSRLSRNSGPATEGFSNRGINFKDVYHNYIVVHRLVYGRCSYIHRMHHLPQTVTLQVVLQLLQSISLGLS